MADQNFRVKRGLEVGIGATVLVAQSSGNIGISSTEPTAKLDVDGTVNISGVTTITSDLELTRGTDGAGLTRYLKIGGARNNGSTFGEIHLLNYDSQFYLHHVLLLLIYFFCL